MNQSAQPYVWAMPLRRLEMALFYSPHLIKCGLFYCCFRRKNIPIQLDISAMADYFLFCRLSGALVSNNVCRAIRRARERVDLRVCRRHARKSFIAHLGIRRP
jgi:hypothetical protein